VTHSWSKQKIQITMSRDGCKEVQRKKQGEKNIRGPYHLISAENRWIDKWTKFLLCITNGCYSLSITVWATSFISLSQKIVPRVACWSGHMTLPGSNVQCLVNLNRHIGLICQSVKLMPSSHYVNSVDDSVLIHCRFNSTYYLFAVIYINIAGKIVWLCTCVIYLCVYIRSS
jgi:hypothetical protein